MYGVPIQEFVSLSQLFLIVVTVCLFTPFLAGLFALRSAPQFNSDKLAKLPVWAVGISLVCSFILFINAAVTDQLLIYEGPLWFAIGHITVFWSFLIDPLTSVMLLVITLISFLVHFYSLAYMSHDYNLPKFMGYLSLFTFFMMMLVTAGNLPQMFFGWEGVGLLSFLLINFWNTRMAANKAAIKAVIVNKIGDFFFMVAIGALAFSFGTMDLFTILAFSKVDISLSVFNSISIFGYKDITFDFCCIMLLLAAMAKSAQIPFHTWLPDAMEGPSPVSALLHAATMVTAGVFLICRFSSLFQHSPFSLWICTIVGAITAIFAATSGFFQNDIKRIVALSTCSQIGYMFFVCGLSGFNIAMFHLFNHAFFKAGLFLCCGAIIHALNDEQDIRRMGALSTILPLSTTCMIICSFSLAGFPFLTGYYSKDAILELAYASHNTVGIFAFILGLLAAFCTALYSVKLIYLVFITRPNTPRMVLLQAQDAPFKMALPIVILTFCSIFVGYLFRDMFIGPGTDFWGILMPLYSTSSQLLFSEYVPYYIKLAPSIAALAGALLAIPFFKITSKFNFTSLGRSLYVVFNYKWYFDHIYNHFLVQKVLYLGQHVSYEILDRGILEKLGPIGITKTFEALSVRFSSLQTGLIRHYLFLYVFGLCMLITPYVFLRFGIDLTLYVDIKYFWVIGGLCLLPSLNSKK